jgi:hypothetical protein
MCLGFALNPYSKSFVLSELLSSNLSVLPQSCSRYICIDTDILGEG